MSRHQPEKDVKELEAALVALVPAAPAIDRDRLMFRAGQASARSQPRLWQVSTAALALLSAGLIATLVLGPAAEPVVKVDIPYRLILAIIWVAIASGFALLLLYSLRTLLFHLVVALFLALVLTPAVTRLQRLRRGRGGAIAIVIVVTFVAIVGIATMIAAPLTREGVKFARHAPAYLQQTEKGHGALGRLVRRFHLQDDLKKAVPGLSHRLSQLSGQIISLGRRVASAAFTAAIVAILSIFMLVEGPRSVDWLLRIIPERHRDRAQRLGRSVLRVVSGYTTGVLLLAFLNGLVAGVAMALTGTPFVFPLAVWAAVIDILPIVGGLLAIVPAALFAFAHGLTAGIVVVVSMLVYQQVKNHVLYPVVVGRAVSLNSLLVLVAVLAGAELGHIAGALLAIPVAGALQVLATEIAGWRREVKAEEPATV